MALAAGDIYVQAGKWITRERMVELREIFPIREVVTLQAAGAESALVLVLVAIRAVWRDSKICLA
jgi:hypothetical protein